MIDFQPMTQAQVSREAKPAAETIDFKDAVFDDVLARIRSGEDPLPACPRCKCAPGTYGRFIVVREGIMCNDCQGAIMVARPA